MNLVEGNHSVLSRHHNWQYSMHVLTGTKLLLFAGQTLGLRPDDWLGGDDYDHYEHPQLIPRQDTQAGGPNSLVIPAFIATFLASSITNLLFPPTSLFPIIPGGKADQKCPFSLLTAELKSSLIFRNYNFTPSSSSSSSSSSISSISFTPEMSMWDRGRQKNCRGR